MRPDGSPRGGLYAAALAVTAVTLILYPLQRLDPGVSSGVLYVLGVLLVSVHWGLARGLLTSFASAAALYFLHTEPAGSFAGKSAGDLVAIGNLLLTCVVAAVIADRARLRAVREAERIRLEEVRASRARVLAAADAERQRVVRDLHDGAQQRMVHAVMTLKLARRAFAVDQAAVEPLVDEALEHAAMAQRELRELAHGILPAVLTRGGIRAGVSALTARMPLPVDVDIDVGRLPRPVEATAYFIVAEALTNVAKHADAGRVAVTAVVRDQVLRVHVRDDGVGGAVQSGGNGLVGLEDRLAVLHGELHVESPEGGGTDLRAAIPLPAAGSA